VKTSAYTDISLARRCRRACRDRPNISSHAAAAIFTIRRSDLILINGCLCCNLSLYADCPECIGASCKEIRVVEEQPAWQAGSLESLDVIDKVPDESVKLAADQ
jgi:hypothetical protein